MRRRTALAALAVGCGLAFPVGARVAPASAACEAPHLVFEGRTYYSVVTDAERGAPVGQGRLPVGCPDQGQPPEPDLRVPVDRIEGVPVTLGVSVRGDAWVSTDASRADLERALAEAAEAEGSRDWIVAGCAAVLLVGGAAAAWRYRARGRRAR